MIKRPTKLTIVAWIAILIGTTAITGGGGLLLLRTEGQGAISFSGDYQTFIQIIFGVIMFFGGMESLFRKPWTQKILLICYSIVLLLALSYVWRDFLASDYDLNRKIIAIFGNLTILAPTIFSIYVLRSTETKLYFENEKT